MMNANDVARPGFGLGATGVVTPSRSTLTACALKKSGMAAAVEWRESRRCPECRALAYVPCEHRPNGFAEREQ